MPFLIDQAQPVQLDLPLDPEDLDATRPVDIDLCPQCWGEGCVTNFTNGEWHDLDCWACGGTGERGAA